MIIALVISSCAVDPSTVSANDQTTASETKNTTSESDKTTTSVTEVSHPTTEVSAEVDPVLPTDFEDVYFGDKSNEDIYQAVICSENAIVVKSILNEEIPQGKVAVEVFAHDTSSDGDDDTTVLFEVHKHFENLGIETYFWGKGTVIIVNKSRFDELGAIPGHETYSVGYALYELPLATPFYSERDIRMAEEKYMNTDKCVFIIRLHDLSDGGTWKNEIYYRFYIAGQDIDNAKYVDFIKNGIEAYSEKMIRFSGIDPERYEYDEQGTLYAKISTTMYLTLTKDELEKILSSKSYITKISFFDPDAVMEPY